jgi:hypothetical protein
MNRKYVKDLRRKIIMGLKLPYGQPDSDLLNQNRGRDAL